LKRNIYTTSGDRFLNRRGHCLSQEIFWAIIGILSTIIIALVGSITAVRNEIAKRSERKWQRALDLARIIADESSPNLVKEVARLGLREIGFDLESRQKRVEASNLTNLNAVYDTFDPPPSIEQTKILTEALEEPKPESNSAIDPDIAMVLNAFDKIEAMRRRISEDEIFSHPDGDIKLRIAFIIVTYSAIILWIAAIAIKAALFK
jgi:hypothetical protein